jgi:hypothetical protein
MATTFEFEIVAAHLFSFRFDPGRQDADLIGEVGPVENFPACPHRRRC